jgi:hypothetical protein
LSLEALEFPCGVFQELSKWNFGPKLAGASRGLAGFFGFGDLVPVLGLNY